MSRSEDICLAKEQAMKGIVYEETREYLSGKRADNERDC